MNTFKSILFCALLCLCPFLYSGCQGNSSSSSSNEEADGIEQAIKSSDDQLELLELYLQQYRQQPTDENLEKIVKQMGECEFTFDEDNADAEEKKLGLKQKIKAEAAVKQAMSLIQGSASRAKTEVIAKSDYLMDHGMESFPFYIQKGDKIFYSANSDQRFTVKLYNADSHALLKTYSAKTNIADSLVINNSAIYLLEVVPTGNQYMDIQIMMSTSDMSRLGKVTPVYTTEVSAKSGDFRARSIKGVNMTNLFEEPRKFTLRGQLKAAFSGSHRALVAVQVPNGASDILYSLRISTNEGSQSEDGQFAKNMDLTYHRIKFLGLPLYESSRGSGLIAQLLGDNQPVREEDAYINMYVFFDAGQARKFQDGKPTSELKYHVDYSTMGTQSCNGRIPSKGCKTVYLGFENERIRYNNYVWLEAVSAVPTTEYVKEKYSVNKNGENAVDIDSDNED